MRWYELFGYGVGVMVFWLLAGAAVLLMVPYALLRWRDAKRSRRDPQLGVKVALHFLMTLAILTGLSGLTVVLVNIFAGVEYGDWWNEPKRAGSALFATGFVLTVVYWWLVRSRTNDRKWPATRRTFAGCRFILDGMVVLVSLSVLMVGLFIDESDMKSSLPDFLGVVLVWGLAWAIDLGLLLAFTKQPDAPGYDTRCISCGYDLRGSVEAGGRACPECGTLVPDEQFKALTPAASAAPLAAPAPVAAVPPLPSGSTGQPPPTSGGTQRREL